MNLLSHSISSKFSPFRLFSSSSISRAASINQTTQMSMATTYEHILVDNSHNKKLLTLNRPKALNSLTLEMVQNLYAELKPINEGKSEANLVVLKGVGERAFCAGGDVVAVTKSFKEGTSIFKDFFYNEYKLNHLIGTLKVPFVALIDGITMGGGCGLSLNGRFRVATERTMLAMPETALGLFPDVGASFFLSRLRNNLGIFLGLTGHRLLGADVFHAGLATHYVESKDLDGLTQALMELPREKCDETNVRTVLNRFAPTTLAPFYLQKSLNEIEEGFDADTIEKVLKNLEKIGSEFAKEQISVLQKMSPTSLKVALREIREGKNLQFDEVFPIEYRLTQRFVQEHDFHEGCRAILIDKDRQPKWQPSKLSEVSDSKIDWYFSPLENSKDELVF